MNGLSRLIAISTVFGFLTGCSSPHIALQHAFWTNQQQRVAVAAAKVSYPGLYHTGSQGLMDTGISNSVTYPFRTYLKSQNMHWYWQLRLQLVDVMQHHHIRASLYPRVIDVDKLSTNELKANHPADKNFHALSIKMAQNRLLLIDATEVGAARQYFAFIPTGAPKAICNLSGRLINLKNNNVLWRYSSSAMVDVSGNWDQPPLYLNFTIALKQAIARSTHELLADFVKHS